MLALMKDGALVLDGNDRPITAVEGPRRLTLPNGATVSPLYDGWTSDDGYSLVTIAEADAVPDGKRITDTKIELVGGSPKVTYDFADVVITADEVRTEAARRLDAIGAPYSPQERETWATQVTEAKAVLADANALTPLLTALAAADGTDVATFAAKVLAKEAAFATAAGAILAAQRTLSAMDPIPLDYADDSHWS